MRSISVARGGSGLGEPVVRLPGPVLLGGPAACSFPGFGLSCLGGGPLLGCCPRGFGFGRGEVTADRPFYSGKHHRHGMNLQVIASPHGDILWVPGATRPDRGADLEHRARTGRLRPGGAGR